MSLKSATSKNNKAKRVNNDCGNDDHKPEPSTPRLNSIFIGRMRGLFRGEKERPRTWKFGVLPLCGVEIAGGRVFTQSLAGGA